MTYRFTSSFPYLLNRVGVRMGELFSQRLAKHDLTLPMYRVMAVLRQEGPQRLNDLGMMVTVEVSTLSRLVTTMKKMGLVSRERPEENARTVRIDLTKAGKALVDELMPVAAQFEEVGIKSFSDDEIAWLKNALRQIHDNLEELDGATG
jgi:MarR family transcriptional regulator, organic hydroperoxide resistance regulator